MSGTERFDADGPTLPGGEPTQPGSAPTVPTPPAPAAPADQRGWATTAELPTHPPTAPPPRLPSSGPPSPPTPGRAPWPDDSGPGGPRLVRNAIGIVLLFVAGLSAFGTLAAAWTRQELRSEDTWAATAQALADDPEVQQAVADLLAAQVISVTGADDLISGVLPGVLGNLADPLTDKATEAVSTVALEVVRTSAFQSAWEAAVRSTHQELLATLDGDGRFTEVTSQGLVLDLGSTFEQFRTLLDDRGLTFLDGIDLSGIQFQVVLLDAPGVQNLVDLLDLLDTAVVVLPIVAAVTAVLGLVIARRRSWAVVAGGLGVLVSAGATWALVGQARDQAVDQVSGGVLGPTAVGVVADQVVADIRAPVVLAAVVGVVIVVLGVVGAAATTRRS